MRMPLRPYLSLLLLLRDDEIPVDELRRMVRSVNRGVDAALDCIGFQMKCIIIREEAGNWRLQHEG